MVWQERINRISLAVARRNVGLTTIEATSKILANNPRQTDRVSLWEAGESAPTRRQLEMLAEIYNVNPLQLLLKDAIKAVDPPAAFRSNRKRSSSYNLNRFISVLRSRQAVIGDSLRRDGIAKHALVGGGRHIKDPEDLAKMISREIGYDVDKKPKDQTVLKYLRGLVHDRFIFVLKTMSTSRDLIDTAEMRGMYLHDSHAPFIVLNRRDYKTAQLFSLAHELAHLFRAEERIDSIEFRQIDQVDRPEETFCNLTAAALLIPRSQTDKGSWSLTDIKDLAEKGQVSSLVALYRLGYLNKISPQKVGIYSEQLQREYESRQSELAQTTKATGGNYYNNMRDSNGELFNEVVFSVYRSGDISAADAQNLLKMPITEI